jgi:actin-like ATPase involved in cell morphogenesis
MPELTCIVSLLSPLLQVSLLQEPVAAAMAFGFGKRYDAELLLVFDLGGGTFDLSLVDSFEGIMEVRQDNAACNMLHVAIVLLYVSCSKTHVHQHA